MKYVIALIIASAFIGCKEKERKYIPSLPYATVTEEMLYRHETTASSVFHLKVVVYPMLGYCIHFTNDNWQTMQDIRVAYGDTTDPFYQVYTGECDAVQQIAKSFKTYNECIDFNKEQYALFQKNLEIYNSKPHPKEDEPKCGKEIQIY